MIVLRDFLLPNNTIDYDAFARALVAGGYHCETCFAPLPVDGKPGRCAECREVHESLDEVRHFFLVRCPHCGCVTDIPEDHPAWVREGVYGQICVCKSDFVFRSGRCLFISPPLQVAK